MSATEALTLESKIAPVLLQAVVPVLSTLGQSDDRQAEVISQAIGAVSRAMPPAEFAALIKELCSQSTLFKAGKRVDFERDFQGGGGVLLRYQVAWFVLETNFADFFGALLPAGVLDRAKDLFAQKMGESTGESGVPASPSLRSAG